MSKNIRLQVLLTKEEIDHYKKQAKANKLTLSQWVRQSLMRITDELSSEKPERKLNSLRSAMKLNAPTGDIEQIESEIESGYLK
jgi:hypothetical protein